MPRTKKEKSKIKRSSLSIISVLTKFLKTYEKHCVQSQTSVCPAIKKALKTSIENAKILRKAILLELRGRTVYPFCTLEIINSQMDLWSVERLSKSLLSSNLLSIVLDYNNFGNEGVDILMSGLENNQKIKILSLQYCNLGPTIGSKLGWAISQSAICELYLTGNYLQCSGALDLIRHIAEFAETQRKDRAAKVLQDRRSPSQQVLPGIKKNTKGSSETGPWLTKLHLADNGIDGRGKEGERGILEFAQLLTYLIKYSDHLREIDLGNNVLGEIAATHILEALRERKKGKLPNLQIVVIPQISSDTFRSIWKNSKKFGSAHKKKKKAKK